MRLLKLPEPEQKRVDRESVRKAEALEKIREIHGDLPTLEFPRISLDRAYFSIFSKDIFKHIYKGKDRYLDKYDQKRIDKMVEEMRTQGFQKVDFDLPERKNMSYRGDVFNNYPQFKQNMVDHKGHGTGLHFKLCDFEDEVISWITISMRQPHMAVAYVNFQKYYRYLNDIPKPTIGNFDTNFLPVEMDDREKIFDDFSKLFITWCREVEIQYRHKMYELFEYDLDPEKTEVIPISIEIPCEYLHRDVAEFAWLSDVAFCKSVVKHSDLTRTMYLNKNLKSQRFQMKIYQKAFGLARMELTVHKDWASHFFSGDDPKILKDKIKMCIDAVLGEYRLSLYDIKPVEMTYSRFLGQLASALDWDRDMLLMIIESKNSEFKFTRDNQSLQKKLIKADLIEREKPNSKVWIKTDFARWLSSQLGGYFICPHCRTYMIKSEKSLEYVCSSCGYSKKMI
ncbi:hypothetical protein [Methanococcus maripaludis]|uniref:Uncharacterized protein n=2 Tax=Methanococcus maripaludis TaxID=39152 RepID=A0A7J9PFT3_METMI|nr:hypothetical protein [Methanococcus maripaludis]MBA2861616.1 hypothetical protein [Methanococcus maripaludis]